MSMSYSYIHINKCSINLLIVIHVIIKKSKLHICSYYTFFTNDSQLLTIWLTPAPSRNLCSLSGLPFSGITGTLGI